MPLATANAKTHARDPVSRAAGTEQAPNRASRFKVTRIEKTDVHEAGQRQHWYRYVLENGRSTIIGQRRGSLKEVTAHVSQFTEELNARRTSTRSVWSSRRKQARTK